MSDRRTYETWVVAGSDGGLTVMARRMLRYYGPEKGHYWAEKPHRMAFDHSVSSVQEEAVRRAWPEATTVEWIGDTERGTLWLADK